MNDTQTVHRKEVEIQRLRERAALARQAWLVAATDGSERLEQLVARDRLLRLEFAVQRAEMLLAAIERLHSELDQVLVASAPRALL